MRRLKLIENHLPHDDFHDVSFKVKPLLWIVSDSVIEIKHILNYFFSKGYDVVSLYAIEDSTEIQFREILKKADIFATTYSDVTFGMSKQLDLLERDVAMHYVPENVDPMLAAFDINLWDPDFMSSFGVVLDGYVDVKNKAIDTYPVIDEEISELVSWLEAHDRDMRRTMEET